MDIFIDMFLSVPWGKVLATVLWGGSLVGLILALLLDVNALLWFLSCVVGLVLVRLEDLHHKVRSE